jgi:hypothetical protein
MCVVPRSCQSITSHHREECNAWIQSVASQAIDLNHSTVEASTPCGAQIVQVKAIFGIDPAIHLDDINAQRSCDTIAVEITDKLQLRLLFRRIHQTLPPTKAE